MNCSQVFRTSVVIENKDNKENKDSKEKNVKWVIEDVREEDELCIILREEKDIL